MSEQWSPFAVQMRIERRLQEIEQNAYDMRYHKFVDSRLAVKTTADVVREELAKMREESEASSK